MDVNYDSGCKTMALPVDDLAVIIAPYPVSAASGKGQAKRADIKVRLLTSDKTNVLLPLAEVSCHGYVNIHHFHRFTRDLFGSCFIFQPSAGAAVQTTGITIRPLYIQTA